MRCGGWALALKRGNCGCLANEQGLPVRSQGSSSRETVAQLSSWRHVMPRPGLGTPERPEWELGAGGQEPKDRSFEAVSDAVSSAEERKQSQPPSSSEGKKKKAGVGVVLGRKPQSRAISRQCPTRVAGDPRPVTPARGPVSPVGPANTMSFSVERRVRRCRKGPRLSSASYPPLAPSTATHGQ